MELLDWAKNLFAGHNPEMLAKVDSAMDAYPLPKDLFSSLLAKVAAEIENGRDVAYAIFRSLDDDGAFIQVIRCKRDCQGALINLAYPHHTEPRELLAGLGIQFSGNCRLVKWEPSKNALFECQACPAPLEMATLIDELFGKLFQAPLDYKVSGEIWVQDMR